MKKVILFAGGGTGGHIYPGLSIAQELLKKNKDIEIHFVGTKNGLESKIIPAHNFPLHYLSIGGLKNTTFFSKIITYLKFPVAFFQTLFLLIRLKPQFVFGVGGYSSGPVVLLASLLRFPTGLFESNAIPGITNRILSYFVKVSFALFEESKSFLKSKKVLVEGFPVRAFMENSPQRNNEKLHVLVFGGSQGARGINTTVSDAILKNSSEFQNIQVIHQTGKSDYEIIKTKYANITYVEVFEYLDPIKKYYDWADVVFCRAGASTLSELAACGKAAVLIPFPYAADDHQKKNAQSLVEKDAAIMILQSEFKSEKFIETLKKLNFDRSIIEKLEKNIKKFHKKDAASRISDYILSQL